MEDVQTPPVPAPEPKPRRKYTRRKTNRLIPREPAAPRIVAPAGAGQDAGELEGLSREECCFDCVPERCAISGAPVCIHPYKGGIKPNMQSDPVIVRRYQHARKLLARQAAERKV